MTMTPRLLCFAVSTLALLAAGCSDNRTTSQTSTPQTSPYGIPEESTAPNVNNPYATDPQDPDMNPHYMRPRGGR